MGHTSEAAYSSWVDVSPVNRPLCRVITYSDFWRPPEESAFDKFLIEAKQICAACPALLELTSIVLSTRTDAATGEEPLTVHCSLEETRVVMQAAPPTRTAFDVHCPLENTLLIRSTPAAK